MFFLLPKAVFFITEGCVLFYYRRLCFLLPKAVFFVTEGCVFPQVYYCRLCFSSGLLLKAVFSLRLVGACCQPH